MSQNVGGKTHIPVELAKGVVAQVMRKPFRRDLCVLRVGRAATGLAVGRSLRQGRLEAFCLEVISEDFDAARRARNCELVGCGRNAGFWGIWAEAAARRLGAAMACMQVRDGDVCKRRKQAAQVGCAFALRCLMSGTQVLAHSTAHGLNA